ncbi:MULTISPECIES: type I-E CRISPR-associated protein Cas6/Cse3/CasE [unclassified Variovorax]|uniref:type I-E CRISPR-associated protein Cas6/Cse3/CasE n=1 Tax=unclassified Variovorax TaxID=663243 RepID=UPI000B025932|nr:MULTISPECIES: type I-E CRISPR-associated protein Cas6/Cse3/CasE [unclassified Variovorax]PNG50452.1 CRISPR-associated endoribonuclease Cse3 [Variovorax sp. B2]PNG51325.1 CRISPR-associated endoribonuclease Cse3 [Variovorax sp. B4]VTU43254.1 CRISPR-associated endoribonuclease Cse3 [Variovorax sp. PBL-H6]VTU43344.1 CRISPR-associated endoribonuclease Cse3 [Variovorax sp. SRS16]VTU43363.1 CRISPR-associated endoribonuclease Cse3 [Variovorax sp. PBL-E5]
MQLTHLTLPRTRESVAAYSRLVANKYVEHQALWSMLQARPDASREFLYRTEITDDGLEVYVLSPKALSPEGPWRARTREYAPKVRAGQLVGFSLRVSPTEDKAQGLNARSKRVDMVMDRYQAAGGEVDVQTIAQGVAADWLERREESSGFRVVDCSAGNYRRFDVTKRGQHMTKLSYLDITGTLEVQDPARFLTKLATGYGKAKFAGCGLMLLSAPK